MHHCALIILMHRKIKNRRDVCSASEAGYVEYSSLPGAIKTGCPQSFATTMLLECHRVQMKRVAQTYMLWIVKARSHTIGNAGQARR